MSQLDRVVLIGINYVGTSAALNGCINDISLIKEHLRSSLGCTESNTEMRILSEVNHDSKFLPTRTNIIDALKWLVAGAKAGSRLFFHYSGHGSYVQDKTGEEVDRRDETLCPLDYRTAGIITDDELRSLIVDPLPEGAKLWVISDSCHSGSVVDLRQSYHLTMTDAVNEYQIITNKQYPKSRGQVVLLSGCRDDQFSADAWISQEKKYMGALTYSFLESIKELKKTDKEVTYKRLMKHLLLKMKGGGYTQIPQISSGQFLDLNSKVEIA